MIETEALRLEIRDGIAALIFDRPDSKVNLLTRAVMLRLGELLGDVESATQRGEARALLIRSAKPGNFIAGADIDELATLADPKAAAELSRGGQQILQRLENLSIPTLAVIAGTCLGGGLELALACDHRVASKDPSTRLGLPETRLGILPGLGGTVRLPRLIGLQPALDLILSGRQVKAGRAVKLGLVDRAFEAQGFETEVTKLAGSLAAGQTPLRARRPSTVSRLVKEGPLARWLIRRWARKAVLARTRGHYPALPAALDVTVRGLGVSAAQAQKHEAEAFGRLAVTPECKNLIFVFKLTESIRKKAPPGAARPVERAAVIGAGLMGAGIAELFAYQNVPVQVVDIDEPRVQAGLKRARELLEKTAGRAGWSRDELQQRAECLIGATGYHGFETVDLAVEAVLENLQIKREVFARIEERLPPEAVIATNTSALSVSQLQAGLRHPERVCGLHFFNPPHRMPLVELVRGERTSDDVLATAFAVAVRLGKTPVVVRDAPGFVVNRVLAAYLTEAGYLLQAGMKVQTIDRLMFRFGMPMGPLRLLDEIGLDVVAEVSRTLVSGLGERFTAAPAVEKVVALGLLGKKGGRGFYRYSGSRKSGVDPEVESVLAEAASGAPPGPEEAEGRLVYSMINEAARILDDGVVDSPEALDVAMIMGTGFPPFRGGLLRYADSLGPQRIADRLRGWAADAGARLEPAPGLLTRKRFYD